VYDGECVTSGAGPVLRHRLSPLRLPIPGVCLLVTLVLLLLLRDFCSSMI
jgi:hypothetical protein